MATKPLSPALRWWLLFARVLVLLAMLALIGAWISELTPQHVFLGLSQQHLFSDATVLALLSIAVFIDAWFHRQAGNGH